LKLPPRRVVKRTKGRDVLTKIIMDRDALYFEVQKTRQ